MTPVKPFATYKWRWLTVEPSEGFLKPPIFLGILRVLAHHEEEAFSSQAIKDELGQVERDTAHDLGRLTLARDTERNLFRNSKQYWTGTGLLSPDRGVVRLTNLGHRLASGNITQGDFAALMVQQTVLPNPRTYSPAEIASWNAAGLEIRPLALILDILNDLGRRHGGLNQAFLTPEELIKVVIPLAGAKAEPQVISSNVATFRRGDLDVNGWPDCAPDANDKRLAREFLLFLAYYGVCRREASTSNMKEQYFLEELFDEASIDVPMDSIFANEASAQAAVVVAQQSAIPSIIERTRTTVTVLSRPGQAKFRGAILNVSEKQCLLTGEAILETLEAAHIIPVEHGGSDEVDNGLCMRVDIHRLFDSGHLRLKPDGAILLSDGMERSRNYSGLPRRIAFPRSVNLANVTWRDNYY